VLAVSQLPRGEGALRVDGTFFPYLRDENVFLPHFFCVAIEAIDRSMAANIQFHIGDKCFFTIAGQKSEGEIIRLHSKPGQHLVRWRLEQSIVYRELVGRLCLGLSLTSSVNLSLKARG